MIIYDPKITGSFQVNGSTVTSIGDVDTISGSVAALNAATSSYALSSSISGSFTSLSASLSTRLTDDEGSIDSLNAASSSYLLNTTDTLTGDLTVTGTITAQEFHTEYVSGSIIYTSGSTKFGDTYDDIHEFTGSVNVTNSTGGVTGSYTFTGGNFTVSGDDADFNLDITSGSALANLTEFRFRVDGGTMGRLYMHKGTKHMYLGPTYFPTSSLFLQDGTGTVMSITGSSVGIGTSAPETKLDILGSTQDQLRLRTAGSEHYRIGRDNSDGLLYFYGSQTGYTGYVFDGVDGERMRIASDGKVTITGDSNSTAHLKFATVSGGSTNTYIGNFIGSMYLSTNYYYDGGHSSDDASKGSMEMTLTDDRFQINSHPAGSPGTRTRILTVSGSAGNVGIGTELPIYKLHVNSSTQAARFTAGDGGYAAVTFDGDAGNTIGSLTTHNGLVYLGSINSGGTGANGEIRIEPFGGNVMTLDSTGNVGIGNTDPLHKLSVSGNSYFSDQLRVDQPIVSWSDSGTKHYTHLATFSGYGSAASALIINTNIPGHNQSGNGNMFTFRIVGYSYGSTGLIDMLVGCYAGENNYYSAWWTGTGQTNWVDNVYVYTNSSGKVAFQIGETTDSLNAEIAITDFVQGFGNVNTSYADSWSCSAVTTLPTQTQKTTLGYKAVAPDIYEDVTFHNNVGIGGTTSIGSMTSGGGLLTIGRNGALGTDDVVGALSFHTNDASFTAYHADGISAQISAHSDNPNGASGRLSFYTAYGSGRGERMRITSNGDVGIGNTSPYNYSGYKSLTIGNGSSTGLIKFGTGADANGPEIFSSTSTGGLIFNSSSTGTRFRYYSSAGEYSFSTNGPSTGNGVLLHAEHTSQSTGFHYYFSFLESKTNASAAGIKAGGILASATYNVANPDRGDIYAQDNISALSFTDRTPYPSSLEVAKAVVNSHQRRTDAEIEELVTAAYNRIQSQVDDMPQPEKEALTLEQYKAKYSKEYELDHNVLHDYVNDTKYADQGIEARDLSATVSCLVEVVKDLMQRIDTLEGN